MIGQVDVGSPFCSVARPSCLKTLRGIGYVQIVVWVLRRRVFFVFGNRQCGILLAVDHAVRKDER